MLDPSALKQMHPVIMTPSHDGKYCHNYVISLLNLSSYANSIGLNIDILLQRGESLITRARNNAVADFMCNPQWTHLFWIDSDIGFEPEAALRLLLSDYDVAAGVYPLKCEKWPDKIPQSLSLQQIESLRTRYTVNTKEMKDTKVELVIRPDGFMEMGEAPTGFMVIKRSVFEKMMTAYPELKYVPDSIGHSDHGFHYRLFDVMVDPESKRYLSEDYGFCYLWRQLGGKVYIDCNSNLTHQGIKLYTGNFANSLRNNLPTTIGAPLGAEMFLSGIEHLK